MSKTYRKPMCREDWQDITKLRFKDSDDKIAGVFVDSQRRPTLCPVTLIVEDKDGNYLVWYYQYDGIAVDTPEQHSILVEEQETNEHEVTLIAEHHHTVVIDLMGNALHFDIKCEVFFNPSICVAVDGDINNIIKADFKKMSYNILVAKLNKYVQNICSEILNLNSSFFKECTDVGNYSFQFTRFSDNVVYMNQNHISCIYIKKHKE